MSDGDKDKAEVEVPAAVPEVIPPNPRYPYVNDPNVPGRRIFNDSAVQRVIDDKVANLPANKHGVVIAHLDSNKNASMSIVGKIGEHWTLVETTDYDAKDNDLSASGELRYSW